LSLDLGGTIWLNVSRKLLSFHRYFFTPFQRMPKEVQEEFHRHSHIHLFVDVGTGDGGSHRHLINTAYTDCNSGYDHLHRIDTDYTALTHTHTVRLTFGEANLGVPNWWEHKHPITLELIDSIDGSHTHTFPTTTSSAFCEAFGCEDSPHTHSGVAASSVGSGGTSHDHTLSPVNTGYAYNTETPENHRHPFNIWLDYADAHVHYIDFTQTATNSTTCPRGYSHNHSLTDGNTNSASHRHNVTGDTGYGGESPPVAGIPGIPLQQMAEVVLD